MKKISMVLALLLLLALLFTSCAKPIVDGATDASGSESVTEGATQSGKTDGVSTDKGDSNNESKALVDLLEDLKQVSLQFKIVTLTER